MRYLLLFCLLLAPLSAQTAPTSGPTVVMPQLDVSAQRQAQLNSIDRKTYFVGQDVQGVAGSAADVLQNIPSVQVDIDGNPSLRGDSNVQVLIDGRSSALMRASNRGDVLSQLPADSIERIEVITNPSAMYKPDGSAGIINIVLKKKRAPGAAGSIRVSVGNGQRYGGSAGANYNPGPFNLGGSLNLREDDRDRISPPIGARMSIRPPGCPRSPKASPGRNSGRGSRPARRTSTSRPAPWARSRRSSTTPTASSTAMPTRR